MVGFPLEPFRPADTLSRMDQTAHITLQSAYGDFDPAFLKRLPALERVMIDHGIDPSDFIISKCQGQSTRLTVAYRPTGHPIDYTVFVKDRSFTVTHPNDMSFLRYFYGLCVNEPKKDDPHSLAQTILGRESKLGARLSWLGRWLNKPI